MFGIPATNNKVDINGTTIVFILTIIFYIIGSPSMLVVKTLDI